MIHGSDPEPANERFGLVLVIAAGVVAPLRPALRGGRRAAAEWASGLRRSKASSASDNPFAKASIASSTASGVSVDGVAMLCGGGVNEREQTNAERDPLHCDTTPIGCRCNFDHSWRSAQTSGMKFVGRVLDGV